MLEKENKVIVESGSFSKSVIIPTSKSYANRILILAALCPSVITIEGLPESTDVSNLISCLQQVGLEFSKDSNFPPDQVEELIEHQIHSDAMTEANFRS